MINLESLHSAIKNPTLYGIAFALVGAIGIFSYSVYYANSHWEEKEEGDNFITIQLSAFAPQDNVPIADKIQKPRHHKPKRHKPKIERLESPPKDKQSNFQPAEEIKPEEKVELSEEIRERPDEMQESKQASTVSQNTEALADENLKVLRYSDGTTNDLLKAIHLAIQKRHTYPDVARQRGYEGDVLLRFRLDTNGIVSKIEIIRPSKYKLLNKRAIKTVQKACRDFPKPEENMYIEIPIGYALEHRG